MIDLGKGHPQDTILPLEGLRRAASAWLEDLDVSCLRYGKEQGGDSFRAELAALLARSTGLSHEPAELLVTTGASHGLDLALRALTSPGDTVFVEDPTYFLALGVMRGRHLKVVPIPTDRDGIDVDALERELGRARPALVYTIPVFHNPTGAVLPDDRRRRLVELAEQHDFRVVADEVYQLLAAPEAVPPPMASFENDRVISLGSFAKIFGPGLRVGWIHAAPPAIAELLKDPVLHSGGGVNPVTGAILERALRLRIQDQCLAQLRHEYDRRREVMVARLTQTLPRAVRFTAPRGGYFVWLELPGEADVAALQADAHRLGVSFRHGALFSCRGHFRNCMRLCFAFNDERDLVTGCDRIVELVGPVAERSAL